MPISCTGLMCFLVDLDLGSTDGMRRDLVEG